MNKLKKIFALALIACTFSSNAMPNGILMAAKQFAKAPSTIPSAASPKRLQTFLKALKRQAIFKYLWQNVSYYKTQAWLFLTGTYAGNAILGLGITIPTVTAVLLAYLVYKYRENSKQLASALITNQKYLQRLKNRA